MRTLYASWIKRKRLALHGVLIVWVETLRKEMKHAMNRLWFGVALICSVS